MLSCLFIYLFRRCCLQSPVSQDKTVYKKKPNTFFSTCRCIKHFIHTPTHLHEYIYTHTLIQHSETKTQMHKSMTNTCMSHRNWPSSHPQDKRGDNALYMFSSLQLLIIVQSEPLPKNRSFLMRQSLLHDPIVFHWSVSLKWFSECLTLLTHMPVKFRHNDQTVSWSCLSTYFPAFSFCNIRWIFKNAGNSVQVFYTRLQLSV